MVEKKMSEAEKILNIFVLYSLFCTDIPLKIQKLLEILNIFVIFILQHHSFFLEAAGSCGHLLQFLTEVPEAEKPKQGGT